MASPFPVTDFFRLEAGGASHLKSSVGGTDLLNKKRTIHVRAHAAFPLAFCSSKATGETYPNAA
jgi:hypothetical protein